MLFAISDRRSQKNEAPVRSAITQREPNLFFCTVFFFFYSRTLFTLSILDVF